MNRWGILIRREFWENRALWIAPLVAALFLVCSTILLAVRMDDMQYGPRGMFRNGPGMGGAPMGASPFEMTVFVFSSLIFGIGAIATAMYCLDSLYSERRDRSILFWKSLPVSDTQTVLSKAAVALVAMPVLLTAMAIVTNLLSGAILSINPSPRSPVRMMWEDANLVRAYGKLMLAVFTNVLWYAPAVAYAMIASVLSTRVPLVMAAVPLVTLAVGEQVVFGTNHVWGFLGKRIASVFNVHEALTSSQLWGGLLVAAAGFALAIRLRRWRDDS